MTPFSFVARGRSPLTLGEIEVNKVLARQWREDNPEFYATDPASLGERAGSYRLRSRGTHQLRMENANG